MSKGVWLMETRSPYIVIECLSLNTLTLSTVEITSEFSEYEREIVKRSIPTVFFALTGFYLLKYGNDLRAIFFSSDVEKI